MASEFKKAMALSTNIAEEYLASNIADMMLANAKKKAKSIRNNSENNIDPMSPAVQQFRRDERAIYYAIRILMKGKDDFILKNGRD